MDWMKTGNRELDQLFELDRLLQQEEGPDLGCMSLGTLRRICAILEEEGHEVRSDIQGFLKAKADVPDALVQVGRYSIAMAPAVDPAN